jgi:hypothetical protein
VICYRYSGRQTAWGVRLRWSLLVAPNLKGEEATLYDRKRREFLTLLSAAGVAWPLAGRAQEKGRMRRIGVLLNEAEPKSYVDAFEKALQTLGWRNGENLRLDIRWNAGDPERMQSYAADLVAMAPDLIVSTSTGNLRALMEATRTIPIVFLQVSDPVAQGFVSNLAHPGGNITGFSAFQMPMGGKWVDLLGVGLCDASAVIQRKMYRVGTAYCVNANVGRVGIVATRKLRFSCTRCCGLARSSQPGHGRRHRRPRPNIGGLTFWLILAPGYGHGGTCGALEQADLRHEFGWVPDRYHRAADCAALQLSRVIEHTIGMIATRNASCMTITVPHTTGDRKPRVATAV